MVVFSIPCCNGEEDLCSDDGGRNYKPVCECKASECYFKLVIEHAQVIMLLVLFKISAACSVSSVFKTQGDRQVFSTR